MKKKHLQINFSLSPAGTKFNRGFILPEEARRPTKGNAADLVAARLHREGFSSRLAVKNIVVEKISHRTISVWSFSRMVREALGNSLFRSNGLLVSHSKTSKKMLAFKRDKIQIF